MPRGQLPDFLEDDAAASAESRWWHRFGRSFLSADSYGLVLLLVMVTYVVSVSLSEQRAGSIVLTVQLTTVWLTLRTSRARRITRLVATRRTRSSCMSREATASVLEPYARKSRYRQHGERVVRGQRMMQAASDIRPNPMASDGTAMHGKEVYEGKAGYL